MESLGFVLFALLLVVPGYAFLELFQTGKEVSLATRFGLAYGLSLSINAAVVAAYASVSSDVGMPAVIPTSLPLAILAVSLFGIILGLLFRRGLPRPYPNRNDILVLTMTVFLGGFLYAYSLKYPIFPQFDSVDFRSHLQILTSLMNRVDVSQMPLYYGVHFQLLFASVLVGGIPLASIQQAMDIIVFLSPPLFYAAGEVLLSRRAGLIAAFLYVFAGYLWFGGVFDSGLYPNFYGVLSSLTTLVLLVMVVSGSRKLAWGPFLLSIVNLYLSHYSSLAILAPALLMLPVLFAKEREKLLRSVVAFVALALPAVLGYVLFPGLARSTLAFLSGGPGGVLSDTPLSSLLVSVPVLRYVVVIAYSDYSSVILIVFAVLGTAATLKGMSYWAIPVFWLLALLIVAPQSGLAWRFSYVALVPLTLLASLGFDQVITKFAQQSRVRASKIRRRQPLLGRRRLTLAGVALVLLVIASTSWTAVQLADAFSETAVSNFSQQEVYDAVVWMKANLTSSGRILSVSDSKFIYSGILGGPQIAYSPLPDPAQILNSSFAFIITTNVTTVSTTSPKSPYEIYSAALAGSTLVYHNPDVQILRIARR